MTLAPARLEPKFVPRIWGARSLEPLFPEKTNLAEAVGEVWLTGDDCVFASGAFAGRRLADAWREMPPAWAGTRMDTSRAFPLLVKFLFPREWLSVQVHPTDDYAQHHEAAAGGVGKTEMWVALEAGPEAAVLVGLKADVTPERFRSAIADGTVENFLERIPVRAGDAVFVPAGTVHTIGPGLVLCEIQENSDITYRLFDYHRLGTDGKPRALHIEQALAVTNFGAQRGGKVEPVRIAHGGVQETYFVACRYFATEQWEFSEAFSAATCVERCELLIFLAGSGRISSRGAGADYARGQVWLLPAALGEYKLAPAARTALLRTYVPDIADDFERRLAGRGVAEADRARLVRR